MDVIGKEELLDLLSDVQVPILKAGSPNGQPALASAREIYRNYRDVIPKPVVSKLGQRTATGDRSRVLWKLTNALLECGLSAGEVVALVEGTVWNKFGADRGRLWADVNKAVAKMAAQPKRRRKRQKKGRTSVPNDLYLSRESSDPQWMVEGIWSHRSHGIIAGAPKTRKSYLVCDLAVSVATGTPFLGHFPVPRPAPVLFIQEEISDAELRKRLRRIIVSKGLGGQVHESDEGISMTFPQSIPMRHFNRENFNLQDEDDLQLIVNEVQQYSIGLLILDPLGLMLGRANENNAHEVRPILNNLLKIKEATGTGILLVHHYAKPSAKDVRVGGQRMLGSQAFHGWVESALYIDKPDPYIARVEREFRNFPVDYGTFDVEYLGGDEKYEIVVSEPEQPQRRRPTDFEMFCLRHVGTSLKAIADHEGLAERTVKSRVERSQYVKWGRKQGATGRPKLVVVKR